MYQRNYRSIFILLIVCAVLGVAIVLTIKLAKPTLTLTVDEPFNPIQNIVVVGDIIENPSGPGGRTYSAKTGAGKQDITISGPMIETKKLTMQMSYFKRPAISVGVTSRSISDIMTSVLNKTSDSASVRLFDNDLILGTTTDNTGSNVVFALHYDKTKGWKDVSNSFIANITTINPSMQARSYFDELSQD